MPVVVSEILLTEIMSVERFYWRNSPNENYYSNVCELFGIIRTLIVLLFFNAFKSFIFGLGQNSLKTDQNLDVIIKCWWRLIILIHYKFYRHSVWILFAEEAAVLCCCNINAETQRELIKNNMLSGPSLIKVIISIPAWNSILVCVCALKCVLSFSTFVVFNNSAAEDVVTSPISCPMLFNACRYLWKQGGLGSVRHGGGWRKGGRRGWLWLICSSSSLPLFSGRREIESELEAERARVKWRVFRIIDSWLPALRVTSQVYFSIVCECE